MSDLFGALNIAANRITPLFAEGDWYRCCPYRAMLSELEKRMRETPELNLLLVMRCRRHHDDDGVHPP